VPSAEQWPPVDIAAPWTVDLTDGQHSLIQYAIVVAAFALAAMLTRMWSARREVSDRYRPAIHASVAVCTVALLSYLLLAFEFQTGYRFSDGLWRPLPSASGTWSARYMDWTVSVPLLVVEIVAVSAVMGRAASRARWVGGVAAVLIVVIEGGTDFGALLWLGIASSVCFVVVYAVVISVVLRSLPVLPASTRAPLTAAMVVLLVVWFVYPVVYGLQGLASGGAWTTAQHVMFSVADVVAKVVFGLLLLRVARLRTASDVLSEDDVHPESIWVDQLRQSEGTQAAEQRRTAIR
jgi:bacteriorhodopsin